MQGWGSELRERREARGISLEQAALRTRIPVAHLDALEQERDDLIPKGPYKAAYLRAYREFLGIGEPQEAREGDLVLEAPRTVPLWLVRTVSVAAIALLFGVVGWQIWRSDLVPALPSSGEAEDTEEASPGPTLQMIEVTGRALSRVKLTADGEVVFEDHLKPGEQVEARGRRLELAVEGVETVRIALDGERVVPQGRQDMPRRLVFIDDRAVQ